MSDTVKTWIEERRAIHTAADTGRWYAFDTGVGSSAIRSDEAVFEDMYMMKPDKTAVVDAHNMFPRALDALNAVLRRHAPHVPGVIDICAECDMSWPCATVTVIESALEAGE